MIINKLATAIEYNEGLTEKCTEWFSANGLVHINAHGINLICLMHYVIIIL